MQNEARLVVLAQRLRVRPRLFSVATNDCVVQMAAVVNVRGQTSGE
jgi:transcription elongation GreA/GreB family factor